MLLKSNGRASLESRCSKRLSFLFYIIICVLVFGGAIFMVYLSAPPAESLLNDHELEASTADPHRSRITSQWTTSQSNFMALESPDFTMNELWRRRFLQYRFIRIYISDECEFIYFITLKMGSKTTRSTIKQPECGFREDTNPFYTCAGHDCSPGDIAKMNSTDFLKFVFARNPISRFESVYNYLHKAAVVPENYSSSHPLPVPITERNGSSTVPSLSNEFAFRHFVHYFYDWVHGKVDKLVDYHHLLQKHLHPLTSYFCLPFEGEGEIKCFHPDFVGHTETMQMDMELLMSKLPNLAKTWNGTVEKKNAAKRERIPKGTIFKYPEELLMICQLYWNDFQCGHYVHVIPEKCQEANEKQWHLPNYCIDLNNEKMRSLNPWEIEQYVH